MLSHSNGGGGAGRATDRLFRALDQAHLDLRMHVDFKHGKDPRVFTNLGPAFEQRRSARIQLDELPGYLAKHPHPELFSPGTRSAISAHRVNSSSADIIDVHWTNFGYLSIEEFGKITKPLVWHMHDMWAFTGGENYTKDDPDARWRSGYTDPKPVGMRWDVEKWVYRRKQDHWTRPRHLITSSSWMAGLVQQSPLLSQWPVHVIPNPVDTGTYCPGPQDEARHALGLPLDVPLVTAVLPTRLDDPRKGFDLLRDALVRVHAAQPEVHLAVVGHDSPPRDWEPGLPATHWLGQKDDAGCIAAYRAADLVVVPSRQDNSPQTATESIACGTPVVAFDASGLPDFVRSERTGHLARSFDTADLANGINSLLLHKENLQALQKSARSHAVENWSFAKVAAAHQRLYENILEPDASTL
jgi:glycosyltransferase involved in cell wall biosynthesis